MSKVLLPNGFHDLLAPEAGRQMDMIYDILSKFEKHGYLHVSPSALEFEKSLLTGAGKSISNETFRIMDPVSHKMMGVRADITTQISRIATTRLKGGEMPLRLAYAGDVFRVKGSGLHAERQFTQAGVELIGVDNEYADAEVVTVALQALKKIGVKDICVDFTLSGLTNILLGDLKLAKDDYKDLRRAISKKDVARIEQILGKDGDLIRKLSAPGVTIEKLQKMQLPEDAKQLCERLARVIDIVSARNCDVNISVDPLDSDKFTYHKGIGFSIFAVGANSELGRGGRYVIETKDSEISANGVTIYLNELLRLLPEKEQPKKVLVQCNTGLAKIEQIQSDGFITVETLCLSDDLSTEAVRMSCDFFLQGDALIAA